MVEKERNINILNIYLELNDILNSLNILFFLYVEYLKALMEGESISNTLLIKHIIF